jgi:hypothetical protein
MLQQQAQRGKPSAFQVPLRPALAQQAQPVAWLKQVGTSRMMAPSHLALRAPSPQPGPQVVLKLRQVHSLPVKVPMDQVQRVKLLAQRVATPQLVPQVARQQRQVHTLTVQAQMDQALRRKPLAA